MEIQGKVFLVTGGGSGLGAATVDAIRAKGGFPVALDLSLPQGIEGVAGNVLDDLHIAEAIELAERRGPLRGVVNCAGVATAQRTVGMDGPLRLDAFERVIRVNLTGTFNVIRLAAAAMMKNEPEGPDGERGVIINTSSVAAFDGQIGQAAYSASKAAVAGMTLPLAREFARVGIRVMAIAPGLFDTPLLAGLPAQVKEQTGRTIPFPSRLGHPEEFARLAVAIVENPMLNGEVIRLDGALRMPPK